MLTMYLLLYQVELFDQELSDSRSTAIDGETRRAIGAALTEEARRPTHQWNALRKALRNVP